MISLLFSEDYNSIKYSFDSGFFASVIGSVTLFIVYRIDTIIKKTLIRSSRFTLFINFFISFIITAFIFFITSFGLNIILRNDYSLSFSFFKEQIMIINYLILIILAYHTIAYFTASISEKNKKLKADNLEMSSALNKYLKRIPSIINKKTSLIPIGEILYFKIEDGVVFAHLNENKKNPLTITTLNALESKINPSAFFRINRSEIVNIDKIISFEPYFKDRLAIKLSDHSTVLYTSNAKSASFKNWLVNPTDSEFT